MKKNIAQDFEPYIDEVNKICKKVLAEVKYNATLVGLTENHDWDSFTSPDFLARIKSDMPKSPFNYYVDFGGHVANKFQHILRKIYPDYDIVDSGYYYYPPTGYMSWHTNSDSPGKRVYITYSTGNSSFRYLTLDGVQEDPDNVDAPTVREFDIPELPEKMWHCVRSEDGDRISFGFRLNKK